MPVIVKLVDDNDFQTTEATKSFCNVEFSPTMMSTGMTIKALVWILNLIKADALLHVAIPHCLVPYSDPLGIARNVFIFADI